MRRIQRPRTRFSAWVERETVRGLVASLSRLTPITGSAVRLWLDGRREPRLSTAGLIVQISGGAVTLEDILEHRKTVRRGRAAAVSAGVPPHPRARSAR